MLGLDGRTNGYETAGVPITRPESPRFANGAEKRVWDVLRTQLGPSEVLISGLRFTDRTKDFEADAVLLLPDFGVVVVEVKGGQVWPVDAGWMQLRGGSPVAISPAKQAMECKYGLRNLVEKDPRWSAGRRRRVRWAHAVVVPNTEVGGGLLESGLPALDDL